MMFISTIVGELLLGWLAADLVTGAFHWWEDNFGDESWPVLGAWLIAPNRLHHIEPLAFTRGTFLDRNLATIITAAIIGAALVAAFGPSFFLVALITGSAISNEVHRFAHQPNTAPGWVRTLQEIGLLQSPRGHSAHHRPPHLVNYCVLTDWLNAPVEAVRATIARHSS